MNQTTRPSIDRLKKQAKALKKEAGITHCQALHLIAKNHGFNTWLGLLAAYEQQATH
ncbi:hypothetical protein GNE00_15110 [Pseudomonas sp. JL972]|uniref:glyoxalase superfamily protein n=1 Tax=Stutzerimonas degradans TaxID=2968968 RepID=UPI0012D9F92C|nr:glyoxalase superfamily protein [Stutzerimonas degradans]MTZ15080.1 hypothetical protein [Stutzerimonas degradans]